MRSLEHSARVGTRVMTGAVLRAGRRSIAVIVLAAVLMSANGCGTQVEVDEQVGSAVCLLLLLGTGVIDRSEDPAEFRREVKTCVKNLQGEGGKLLERGPLSFSEPPSAVTAGRAIQSGESLLAVFGAGGRVTASEFSKVTLDVPVSRLKAAGAQEIALRVSTQVLKGGTFGAADTLFDSMEVVLNDGSGEEIARKSSGLTVEAVGGAVDFERVPVDGGVQAVIEFSGGAVRDAALILGAQAMLRGDPAAFEDGSAVTLAVEPVDLGGESARAPAVRLARRSRDVAGPDPFLMAFVRARGSVKSKKVPKVVLDLTRSGKGKAAVDVGLRVMTERYKAPSKKFRPKSMTATLFTVKKGKTKKVKTATGKLDKAGNATIRFEKVTVPKGSDLRVVVRLKGRKVKDALIVAYGNAV